jgi:hypothetical protein
MLLEISYHLVSRVVPLPKESTLLIDSINV